MANPTLIQHVHCSNMRATSTSSVNQKFHIHLPNPCGANNCIIVYYFMDNTGSPTVTATDDQSNTYVRLISGIDGQSNQHGFLVATGVTAGAQHITVSSTVTNNASFRVCHASEFYNVSTAAPATATDGSSFHSGSSSTVTAGSITPTQSGDLFVQGMTSGSDVRFTGATAGSQSNITWALLGADRMDGSAVQWGVYNSTSAINPTMTVTSATNNFGSVAVVLKSASAGTAPSAGIRITRVLHSSFWTSSLGIGPGYANPQTIQIPCSDGDSLIAVFVAGAAKVTSMTGDSNSNTWTNIGTEAGASFSTAQMFYAQAATTTDTQTVVINFPDTTHDLTCLLYVVTGGHQSAFFDRAGTAATGNQATWAASILGASVTPRTASGLVIGTMGVDNSTVTGVSGAGFMLDSAYDESEDPDGPQNEDQNNGWAHFYNPNTGAVAFTFTFGLDTLAEDNWASLAAAFSAAPVISGGVQATTATPYIGLWSKDGVLYTGTFDAGIPIQFGLFDDGYVAQFSGSTVGATATGMTSAPVGVFDRDAQVSPLSLYGAN